MKKLKKYEVEPINSRSVIIFDIETTGLDPWYDARVTCICAKTDTYTYHSDQQTEFEMVDEEEIVILRSFIEYLKKFPSYKLVTCNGKGFDVPFILTRIARLDSRLLKSAMKQLHREHFDIQQITQKRISLNNMATLFGLGQKTGTGKEAIKLFKSKSFTLLKDYCWADVKLTQQVYEKVRNL